MAGTLAATFIATGSLAIGSIIPTISSDGSKTPSTLTINSGSVLNVQAAETYVVTMGAIDFNISSGKITGLSSSGESKLAAAFALNRPIKIVPESDVTATEIGAQAFEGKFITSDNRSVEFVIPDSVTKIGDKAFLHSGISGKLTLPAGLTEIGYSAFQQNEITEVEVKGTLTSIDDSVFSENRITSVDLTKFVINGEIPNYIFSDNKITHINIPGNVKVIGDHAFNNNYITALTIPANVEYIGSHAFARSYDEHSDYKITDLDTHTMTLNFEKDGAGNGIKEIGSHAFSLSGIVSDNLTFPKSLNYIGNYAFEGGNTNSTTLINKISKVSFEGIRPEIKVGAFSRNNIESIDKLNSVQLNSNAFMYNKNLKNISFDYSNFAYDIFGQLTFTGYQDAKGSLRSLKIPARIREVWGSAFDSNKGWYEGTDKVALYRIGTDGKYVIDNAVEDPEDSSGHSSVFNPVLLELSFKDKDGNDIRPVNIERKRSITNTERTDIISVSTDIDYQNFKLGDKLTFTLNGNIPEGYELIPSGLVSLGNNKYELTLDPENLGIVQDVSYGDGYEVGYKKTVIGLRLKQADNTVTDPGENKPKNPDRKDDNKNDQKDNKDSSKKDDGNKKSNTESDKKDNQSKKDNTANDNNSTVPSNPTINTPSASNQIVNPGAIPNDEAVFNVVDENGNPLGKAVLDKDKGTYTFVDDNRTPQGVARINKDKTLEVVKVFDEKAPLGTLPRTGGSSEGIFVILGASLIALGAAFKKKFF